VRIGVVFFAGGKRERVAEIARALAESLEKQGHQVDLIDGDRSPDKKLTVYEYLVIGTSLVSLFTGKIDPKIGEFLAGAGMVLGKKSFAFVARAPFGAQKGLSRLMKAMEREGLFLRFSEVLGSAEEAARVAGRLKLER
jgi:menaquinone-dependent protoporphyrinogen IX oxidase